MREIPVARRGRDYGIVASAHSRLRVFRPAYAGTWLRGFRPAYRWRRRKRIST